MYAILRPTWDDSILDFRLLIADFGLIVFQTPNPKPQI
jgi:hypothetical protein